MIDCAVSTALNSIEQYSEVFTDRAQSAPRPGRFVVRGGPQVSEQAPSSKRADVTMSLLRQVCHERDSIEVAAVMATQSMEQVNREHSE